MDRQEQIRQDAEETVNKLSRMVNCFDDDAVGKAFSECVMREHRTLQQAMMRVFLHQIKAWSETEFFDLRNEATVMLSKKIMEAVKDEFVPFI